jgi:hypothetical protein
MTIKKRVALAAILALCTAVAGSSGESSAATQTACDVLPAAQVSHIVGQTVTAHGAAPLGMPNATVCLYGAGRPILQLGVVFMSSEAAAAQNVKVQDLHAAEHRQVAVKQKGNAVLTAIAMNGDTTKLATLLDAAAKNLTL